MQDSSPRRRRVPRGLAFRVAPRRIGSVLAGGVVGHAIHGHPGGGMIAPLVLGLWLHLLRGASRRETVLACGAFGLCAGMATETWVPEAAARATSSWTFGVTLFVLLALTHGSLPWMCLGVVFHAIEQSRPSHRLIVAASATFAIETIVCTSGGFVPWVLLGYTQSPDEVGWASLAALGGVPIVSAALMAIAVCVRAILEAPRRSRPPPSVVATLVAALSYPALLEIGVAIRSSRADAPRPAPQIVAVQPNFPREARWRPARQRVHLDRIGRYTKRVLGGLSTKPEFVIWPENVVTPGIAGADLRPALGDWAHDIGATLISGLAIPESASTARRYRNVVLRVAPTGRDAKVLEKQILIPFLESEGLAGARLAWLSSWLGRDFQGAPRALSSSEPWEAGPDPLVAPVLCFEALFPREVARRRGARTRVLATLADDSWIPDRSATDQLARYSAFRAIEQALPHVRVAHGGRSVVHDAMGRVIDSLPLGQWGALVVRGARHPGPRPLCRAALASSLLSGALVALALGLGRRPRSAEGRTRGGSKRGRARSIEPSCQT
ncbi:MAG: hypothetical protein AAGC67_01465 [Myxococcota bacterium]